MFNDTHSTESVANNSRHSQGEHGPVRSELNVPRSILFTDQDRPLSDGIRESASVNIASSTFGHSTFDDNPSGLVYGAHRERSGAARHGVGGPGAWDPDGRQNYPKAILP